MKTLCTVTVFAALVGMLVVCLFLKVPDYVWWTLAPQRHDQVRLVEWMALNIGLPVLLLTCGIAVAGAIFWVLAEGICVAFRRRRTL
jgi:hypothetical protein